MAKFDGMWHFVEKHPFISLMAVSTVVNGAVNLTKAITKPFVKVPEYSVADVVSAVMKQIEASNTIENTDKNPVDISECQTETVENYEPTIVEVTE